MDDGAVSREYDRRATAFGLTSKQPLFWPRLQFGAAASERAASCGRGGEALERCVTNQRGVLSEQTS